MANIPGDPLKAQLASEGAGASAAARPPDCSAPTCQPQDGFVCAAHALAAARQEADRLHKELDRVSTEVSLTNVRIGEDNARLRAALGAAQEALREIVDADEAVFANVLRRMARAALAASPTPPPPLER